MEGVEKVLPSIYYKLEEEELVGYAAAFKNLEDGKEKREI